MKSIKIRILSILLAFIVTFLTVFSVYQETVYAAEILPETVDNFRVIIGNLSQSPQIQSILSDLALKSGFYITNGGTDIQSACDTFFAENPKFKGAVVYGDPLITEQDVSNFVNSGNAQIGSAITFMIDSAAASGWDSVEKAAHCYVYLSDDFSEAWSEFLQKHIRNGVFYSVLPDISAPAGLNYCGYMNDKYDNHWVFYSNCSECFVKIGSEYYHVWYSRNSAESFNRNIFRKDSLNPWQDYGFTSNVSFSSGHYKNISYRQEGGSDNFLSTDMPILNANSIDDIGRAIYDWVTPIVPAIKLKEFPKGWINIDALKSLADAISSSFSDLQKQYNINPDPEVGVPIPDEWNIPIPVEIGDITKHIVEIQEDPTEEPSVSPSEEPSVSPSVSPSEEPSESPSKSPSESPSETPSEDPSGGSSGSQSFDFDDSGSSPLMDLSKFFPFCLPMDFYLAIKLMYVEPEAPVFEIPLSFDVLGHKIDYTLVLDVIHPDQLHNDEKDSAEQFVKFFRWWQVITFIIALIFISIKIIPK